MTTNINFLNESGKMKKYTYNLNYFKDIDTNDKAYWLGFIYADGNITKDRHYLKIDLATKDKNLLYKFVQSIQGNCQIKDYIRGKQLYSRIKLSQAGFGDHLIEKGVVPNKSLILTFPAENIVKKDLQKDFIRGYFDGDGCISYKEYIRETVIYRNSYLSILGIYEFLSTLSKILPTNNFRITHATKNSNSYKYIVTNRKDIRRIFDFLYDKDSIYLERKFDIFQTIIHTMD